MQKLINRLPFEGDEHLATIIMLPYRGDTWRKNGALAAVAYFEIINIISIYEIVYVLVDKRVTYSLQPIENNNNIKIIYIDYNDAWARDTSPIFLLENNKLSGLDFRFNAWGGSYDGLYTDYSLDDTISEKICKKLNINHVYIKDFILEGGSIHSDGKGTILTTEACLLSKGRNPHMSKTEIENFLKDHLHAQKIIWLPHGVVNDETNEHVDNIACFIKPDEIALSWSDEPIQMAYCEANLKVLLNACDSKGNKFKITKIPMPEVMYLSSSEENGFDHNSHAKPRLSNDRLAGSYVNYYQGKDYIILPGFNCDTDIIVKKKFEEIYKDKKVYQVNTKEILLGGGNIHCITMQIPKGDLK